MALNPLGVAIRLAGPVAFLPLPTAVFPNPVAIDPNVARPRGDGGRFDDGGRIRWDFDDGFWWSGDDDLPFRGWWAADDD